MEHIFVEQNIRETVVNYSQFLSEGRAMNFLLPNVLRAKTKVYSLFLEASQFLVSASSC